MPNAKYIIEPTPFKLRSQSPLNETVTTSNTIVDVTNKNDEDTNSHNNANSTGSNTGGDKPKDPNMLEMGIPGDDVMDRVNASGESNSEYGGGFNEFLRRRSETSGSAKIRARATYKLERRKNRQAEKAKKWTSKTKGGTTASTNNTSTQNNTNQDTTPTETRSLMSKGDVNTQTYIPNVTDSNVGTGKLNIPNNVKPVNTPKPKTNQQRRQETENEYYNASPFEYSTPNPFTPSQQDVVGQVYNPGGNDINQFQQNQGANKVTYGQPNPAGNPNTYNQPAIPTEADTTMNDLQMGNAPMGAVFGENLPGALNPRQQRKADRRGRRTERRANRQGGFMGNAISGGLDSTIRRQQIFM